MFDSNQWKYNSTLEVLKNFNKIVRLANFLRINSNSNSDEYDGGRENRIRRFLQLALRWVNAQEGKENSLRLVSNLHSILYKTQDLMVLVGSEP